MTAEEFDAYRAMVASEDLAHREWLDDTQNMRVVALNEACGLMKIIVGQQSWSTDLGQTTAGMAKIFARFLIDGE